MEEEEEEAGARSDKVKILHGLPLPGQGRRRQ